MPDDVRRIVYRSVPTEVPRVELLDRLLARARANNGLNGISGLLLASAGQYVQVLEGSPEAVSHTMALIRDDPRHCDVAILSDRLGDGRLFGDWTMAALPGDRDEPAVRERLRYLLRNAPDAVRQAFQDAA